MEQIMITDKPILPRCVIQLHYSDGNLPELWEIEYTSKKEIRQRLERMTQADSKITAIHLFERTLTVLGKS